MGELCIWNRAVNGTCGLCLLECFTGFGEAHHNKRTTRGNITGPDPWVAVWHSLQEAACQGPSYYPGQWLARALSSGAWAQLSSVPTLPSMKARTAHLHADACHHLSVPTPTEPSISLPLLATELKKGTTRFPPWPGMKWSLGLPCTHASSSQPSSAVLSFPACESLVPAGWQVHKYSVNGEGSLC